MNLVLQMIDERKTIKSNVFAIANAKISWDPQYQLRSMQIEKDFWNVHIRQKNTEDLNRNSH